jgi:hypothetical protein
MKLVHPLFSFHTIWIIFYMVLKFRMMVDDHMLSAKAKGGFFFNLIRFYSYLNIKMVATAC